MWWRRFIQAAMQAQGFCSREVDTPMGPVHAWVAEGAGELPPVTLVHGFASSGAYQLPTARALRAHARRVVLPDLLGHGSSAAPAPLTPDHVHAGLRMALDALQPEPMVLVASSFGGWAAVRFAADQPERVRGLVLVSPLGAPMAEAERAPALEMLQARSLRSVRQFLDHASGRSRRRHWVYAPAAQRVLARRPIQDLVARAWTSSLLSADDLRRVRVPVKVVWGRHERLFPEHHLAFWEQLPQVEILRPERSAHSPSIEQPRWFRGVVRDHLEQCAVHA